MSLGMLLAVLPIPFCLLTTLDITTTSDFVEGTFGFYLVGWVLALPLMAFATLYASPVRYQVDISGSAIMDMLVAGTVSGSVAGLSLLAWASDHAEWGSSPAFPLMVLSGVVLGAAAVRGGTLAAFGLFHRKWPNYFTQIAVGGLCGVAVYDLAAIALGRTEEPFISLGWMWTFLGGFGLCGRGHEDRCRAAAAACNFEGVVDSGRRACRRCIVVGLIAFIPLQKAPPINLGKLNKLPVVIPVRNVPTDIHFENDVTVNATLDNAMYTVEAKRPSRRQSLLSC